jgi:peroxiredoxin
MAAERSAGGPWLAGPTSGQVLPSLELRFGDGRPAPLWDYRGRGPLVVFLHDAPGCAACAARLAALAAAHAGFREMGAQVLAIGRAPLVGLPYPALIDPPARLAAALQKQGVPLSAGGPALLIVGRTGAIWAAWSGADAALPDVAEITSWLEYTLSECRECFCCELAWPEDWVRDEASPVMQQHPSGS